MLKEIANTWHSVFYVRHFLLFHRSYDSFDQNNERNGLVDCVKYLHKKCIVNYFRLHKTNTRQHFPQDTLKNEKLPGLYKVISDPYRKSMNVKY